jgi:hypothetical protein
VNLDSAIRDAVASAIRAELPRALDDLLARARLIPIKGAPVSYRLLLAAEKAGELRIYRRGHSAFVEAAALDAWIMAAPEVRAPVVTEAHDEIGEVLHLNDQRRALRKRAVNG